MRDRFGGGGAVNEQELAQRLEEMRRRRRTATRERARRDVTMSLLERQGSVTAADVEAEVERLPQLDEQVLADQVAAKASAAVEVAQAALTAGHDAVAGARAKVGKCEALLSAAQADLEQAEDNLVGLREAVANAETLAEYAAQRGDPSRASVGSPVTARAEVAEGDAKAGAE